MIADLKPYAEYKESGLPWLGRVPGHWGLIPNRGLIRKRKVLVGNRHGDYRLLSLTKQGVIIRDISTGKGKFSSDMGTSQEVRSGDLVFCLFDVPETPRTVGLSQHGGMITGAYTVFESLGRGSAEYFELFYLAMDDRKLLSPLYSGLRNTIPPERFLGTKSPLPPPDEQAAIVRFLDWANGRLDRAIRAKRKVIALLNEQKQAIIHRAVTRGLAPSVPLKPSGIPWLGDIPKHWELWRISRFARVGNGSTPSRGKPAYWNGGTYPWLNSSQINRGYIDSADQFVTSTALRDCHLPKVPAGSVLVAITGQGKTRGMSAVLGIEATINQHIAYIAPRTSVASPQFIQLALTAAYPQLRAISDDSGSTKGALTCADLKRFKLPFPPREEQDVLLNRIQTETVELNTAISRLEREIELLREYRTRLVADVVTGKLDVRAAAAKLPETTNALEPLDDAGALAESDEEAGDADLAAVTQEGEV